jgi:DDE superfamily endonuclease
MKSSSLLNGLSVGDTVMADRGFTVSQELRRLGIQTIIPDFKGRSRSQMTAAECANSEDIAKARIHIERIIQRIRTFHILSSVVRLNMIDIVEQLFTVCSYLVNFQSPIIALNEFKSSQLQF